MKRKLLKLFPFCCLTEQENVTVEELLEKWKLVGHQVKRTMNKNLRVRYIG